MNHPHMDLLAITTGEKRHYLPDNDQLESIKDTPRRWWKAINEMTRGYEADIPAILSKQFDGIPGDSMVVLRGVEFVSLCEHHLMPFTGKATVAYIPTGHRVVGLSKLARLIEAHACRLQVQERMTFDIANDLMRYLRAQGAACVVTGSHTCMSCRGVRKEAEMVTSSLLGMFKTDAALRAEFINIATK